MPPADPAPDIAALLQKVETEAAELARRMAALARGDRQRAQQAVADVARRTSMASSALPANCSP